MNINKIGYGSPLTMMIMNNDTNLVFSDGENLSVIDIDQSKIVNATLNNSGITRMVKLPILHDT